MNKFVRKAAVCAVGVAVGIVQLGCRSERASSQDQPSQASYGTPVVSLDGASIFRNYCASCHGLTGQGDGPAAPALAVKVPSLTTLSKRNHGEFPFARVRETIAGEKIAKAHGSREMPVWGPLFHKIENDQDLGYVRLQNVAEYLNTLQEK